MNFGIKTDSYMKRISFIFLVILISCFCAREKKSDLDILQLKCNNLENPEGINRIPSFSWITGSGKRGAYQSAFQIIMDENIKDLNNESKCFWNSGKINSSESLWISYNGPALDPAKKYYWKLKVWDQNNIPSLWSKTAFFITGLFNKDDWDNAKWIGYEIIPDSLLLVPGVHGNGDNLGNVALKRTIVPCFRKEFKINKRISSAFIFISGLGHYELYINGDRIGDRFLSPGWTNYKKTCFYNTFEVTKILNKGQNSIGVIVGNGFYNINRERYRKLVIAYGSPKMILSLKVRYADGSEETISSDQTWKTSPSPITFSSIYGGEDYDARLEQEGWDKPGFDDEKWKNVVLSQDPGGILRPENDHPLMVMETFTDPKIIRINDSLNVYDFGQNASGIIKIDITGKKAQSVRLIPGELISDDSLVTQKATGAPYYFSYTLKGENEESWIPRFTYYGFRYVQAEGSIPNGSPNSRNMPVINSLHLLHTRNSSPEAGSFKCSNELFNSIYDLIKWSVKSNLASVATDCPHREKLGWLEQTHLMGNSIKYMFDIRNLYDKIIDDMIEAQLENGLVPDIAPEYVPFNAGFRDSPEWGSACIILPWDMYEWYGDLNAVKKAYPMMKRYLSYLESKSDNYLLSHGLGDWYDLGPGFPGEAQLTPKALTATSIWYYDAILLAEMADLTGAREDAALYRNLAGKIRNSFNKKFFNTETKVYSTGSQTAYSMPLYFGMVDEKYRKVVTENLITSIVENNKALTAGDIGYRYLLRVLEQEGYSQLIYEMNSRSDVPGYGFQLSKGATSLTESWAALRDVSNNHMMLGHIIEWFFSGIGGIRQMKGSKGYENILISPEIPGDITWSETKYNSVHGEISTYWSVSGNTFTLRVKIPTGCRATVILPQEDPTKVTESGNDLNAAGNVRLAGIQDGKIRIEITSGDYIFKTGL